METTSQFSVYIFKMELRISSGLPFVIERIEAQDSALFSYPGRQAWSRKEEMRNGAKKSTLTEAAFCAW